MEDLLFARTIIVSRYYYCFKGIPFETEVPIIFLQITNFEHEFSQNVYARFETFFLQIIAIGHSVKNFMKF